MADSHPETGSPNASNHRGGEYAASTGDATCADYTYRISGSCCGGATNGNTTASGTGGNTSTCGDADASRFDSAASGVRTTASCGYGNESSACVGGNISSGWCNTGTAFKFTTPSGNSGASAASGEHASRKYRTCAITIPRSDSDNSSCGFTISRTLAIGYASE